jgi:iron transport multicopper oxidase
MVPIVAEEQFTPTRQLELDVYFDTFDDGSNRASMYDNITWVPPKTPSLMSMLSMGEDALVPSVYGRQTAPQILQPHEVIDLMVINFDGNGHPFHLHGHKFQITRVATDVTSDDPELNPPHTLGNPNPMTRDTIIVPAGGAVNIAFRADNPGAWILFVPRLVASTILFYC